jgi:hypothetical protein
MDQLWWSTEVATAVTGSQSARFPCVRLYKSMAYEWKVDTLLLLISDTARQTHDATVLCKVTICVVECVRMCMQTDSDHFEHILN